MTKNRREILLRVVNSDERSFIEDEKHLRVSLINLYLLSSAMMYFFFGLVDALFGLFGLTWLHAAALALTLLLYRRFKKSHDTRTGAIGAFAILLCVVVTFWMLQQQQYYGFVWLFVLMPVAYILLGMYRGILVSFLLITIVALASLYFYPTWHPAPFTPASIINITAAGLFVLALLGYFEYMRSESMAIIAAKNMELMRMAGTDYLTGLLNRRAFFELSMKELQRSRRYGHAFVIVSFDLDHFKQINDTYGHDAGDAVLRSLAELLDRELRESDFAARFGGEEFVLFLTESTLEEGLAISNRLRERVAAMNTAFGEATIRVTASFGVAECTHEDTTVDTVITRADFALLNAKRNGRNAVCHNASSCAI